ncbi:hypothetical protein E1A91_A07G169000v1 [Gossypium mustelinum]|uniref:ATPase AAA-type core domain-containing protein n=1 Tax=Gossypium mustelinum TaxID=34275 RepID=A0A5D2YMG9_GOSMU|nr:hypothetical protein E1A91_A07G169000v1 [Gossypium mustelinum]
MGQGIPGGLNRQARVGRKQRKQKGSEVVARLPTVTSLSKCKLQLLKLEQIKDYLLMEEEFVVNQERLKPQEEKAEEDRSKVDDLRGSSMSVGNLEELIGENHAIVSSLVRPEYYVGFCLLSVVGLLQDDVDPMVSVMKVEKAPLESYVDIEGLDAQIQEIKEVVELPLTHPELYEDIGIKLPKGVILYGEPRTDKTLLAKVVANSTSGTFLCVVGSELIQKYLGDGPKLVRELFRRTMLELLNQLDGFDSRGDVKVILATNRIESIDPALLRPASTQQTLAIDFRHRAAFIQKETV